MVNLWNQETTDKLRELWGIGLATSEIARLLGTTKNSVIGRARRIRLSSRKGVIPPKTQDRRFDGGLLFYIIHKLTRQQVRTDRLALPPPSGDNAYCVSMLHVQSWQCRYPVGSKPMDDNFYCGRAVKIGSYCLKHAQKCYRRFADSKDSVRRYPAHQNYKVNQ